MERTSGKPYGCFILQYEKSDFTQILHELHERWNDVIILDRAGNVVSSNRHQL